MTTTTTDVNRPMKWIGVVLIVLGIFALLAPMITGISIALLVGVLVMIGGLSRIIWAFSAKGVGKSLLGLAVGGLTFLCGVVLVTDPILATGILTIILAIYFGAVGIAEIVMAFRVRPQSGWGWLLFCGVVSFLLGVMIWQQFPFSGAWAIGIILGIMLLLSGMTILSMGNKQAQAAL